MTFPLLRRTLGVLACGTACIPTLALACAPLIPCEIPLDHAQLFEEYIDTESFREAHPSFSDWTYREPVYSQRNCIEKGAESGDLSYMFILPASLSRFGLEYQFWLPLEVDRNGPVTNHIPNPEELIRATESQWEVGEFLYRASQAENETVHASIGVSYSNQDPTVTYRNGNVGELNYYSATKLFDFRGYKNDTPLKQRSAFCRYSPWICRLFP